MTDKTCKTCIENDYGLCDRKGILVEDDDTACEKHRTKDTLSWRDAMMRTFQAGQRTCKKSLQYGNTRRRAWNCVLESQANEKEKVIYVKKLKGFV